MSDKLQIVLSEDQQRAVDLFLQWYEPHAASRDDDDWVPGDGPAPRFTIGGLAGTGKSTIVQEFLRTIRRAKVCAFTGKAAYVLRSKGILNAETIHSTIYEVVVDCSVCGKRKDVCNASILAAKRSNQQRVQRGQDQIPLTTTQRLCWASKDVRRSFMRTAAIDADLIIVDEASMVSSDILADLEAFGVPILFVGDHGQLEPIGHNPNLMKDPDVRLETIHRQAAGNPIVQFAHRVRRGHHPATVGDDARVIETHGVPANASEYDVVLCGYNKTRKAVNARIRRDRGFSGELPQPGERVVCLRNDKKWGIFNGMQATVLEVVDDIDDGIMMKVIDDLGDVTEMMPINPDQFGAEATLQDASRRRTLWDFGYCLTVHKAQGSEWDRVLVVEQIAHSWSPERWRYTAATRAAKHLTYCVRR